MAKIVIIEDDLTFLDLLRVLMMLLATLIEGTPPQ